MELVRSGQIAESRIDESVRRLLRDKFRLGLFDNPYVDPDAAEQIVGSAAFRAAGEQAQRRSIVLLKNGEPTASPILPLQGRPQALCRKHRAGGRRGLRRGRRQRRKRPIWRSCG